MTIQNIEQGDVPAFQPDATNDRTKSLVEWAAEAQAANHLAKALVMTPFAGSWKGDEHGATAAILKGSEVGLTPVTALGAFDNIQGTPAPKAITLRALVQAHGHDLEITESTSERAAARYRRNGVGEWQTVDFTIEEARQMKLTGKDNWQRQPANMLIARVTSKAARLVAADVILGIGYSAEEIRDTQFVEGEVVSARPSAVAAPRGLASVLGGPMPAPAPAPVPVAADDAPADVPPDFTAHPITKTQENKIGSLMKEAGITDRAGALLYVNDVLPAGREVAARTELTHDEAESVIAALKVDVDALKASTEGGQS